MTYKTILAYLPSPDRVPDIMNIVIPMAERHGAHIVGLHVMAEVQVYGAVAVEVHADFVAQQHAARLKEAKAVEAVFESAGKATDVSMEWRCEDVVYYDFGRALTEQARLADLVVVSQKDNDPFGAWGDLPIKLILDSGRPVLVVPRVGTFNGIGKNVIVAWNGSRESARAAFDAIPLLQEAENVTVMVINPSEDDRKNSLSAGDDLALVLSRHGIKTEARMTTIEDISVQNELASRASDLGADLIVMGCYGHSRIHETIFGGATREMMQSMPVPVLMSH